MKNDVTILGNLKSGKNSAYKYIYDNYYKLLCYIAYEYLEDYNTTEIIVGDVILHMWLKRETIQIHTSLRHYLIQSVKNRCISYLRNNPLQISFSALENADPADYSHPLAELIEKELDTKINECIDSLPELTRNIYILHRFHNKKYNEIADELGISQDVVKYHMKSALSKLRESLKEYLLLLLLIKNMFM